MKMKFALGKEDRDIQRAFRRTVDTYIKGEIRPHDAEAYLISRFVKHPNRQWEILFPELADALVRVGRIEKNEPSSFGKGLWALFETIINNAYKKDKPLALAVFIAMSEDFSQDNWVGQGASRKLGLMWEGYLEVGDRIGFYWSCAVRQGERPFRVEENKGWGSVPISRLLKAPGMGFSYN